MTSTAQNDRDDRSSRSDRKMHLLESMLSSQKQIIQLLSSLNNNVEELLLDVKDIKLSYTTATTTTTTTNSNSRQDNEQFNNDDDTTALCCQQITHNIGCKCEGYDKLPTTPTTSYDSESGVGGMTSDEIMKNDDDNDEDHQNNFDLDERLAGDPGGGSINEMLSHPVDNNDSATQTSNFSSYPTSDHSNNNNNNTISNIDILQAHSNIQQHVMASLFNLNNSLNSIMTQRVAVAEPIKPSKPVKTGLREFSTYVSRAVRQEFGSNYLAMTRINELDRFVMQRIKEEAVAKFLPPGVSEQLAWNHAMNSLRQLRHRVCKKAKGAVD